MKKESKKKLKWQQYVGLVFMLLIGFACGVGIIRYMEASGAVDKPFGEYMIYLLVLLVCMYAAMFLQTIIHEAGHLVFGLLSGYTFSSFRIGRFMWIKLDGKIRFKQYSLAGTGGQCLMVPPELVNGKIPVVLSNLGGVILNIMSAAVCAVACLLLGKSSLIGAFLLMMAVIGFAYALINGIPMHAGAVDNDGMNALALGKNEAAMRAYWVQLKANAEIANGKRIKDMPDEWFTLPEDCEMGNSMVATIAVFAANRMVDAHKFKEADALMAHLLEIESGIVGLHRAQMITDRMFIELIGENRKDVVDAMLTKEQKQIMKAMKRHPSVIRTEYAYALLAEKDEAKAEKWKNAFEKCAKTHPYISDVESESELIAIAEKKARESTPS